MISLTHQLKTSGSDVTYAIVLADDSLPIDFGLDPKGPLTFKFSQPNEGSDLKLKF
jgi:hypothetical protein